MNPAPNAAYFAAVVAAAFTAAIDTAFASA